MSQPDPSLYASTSSLTAQGLKAQLQMAWENNKRLRLEELMLDAVPSEWEDTLCLLVQAEWELRIAAGEPANREEYLQRFPTSKKLPGFFQRLQTVATPSNEHTKTIVSEQIPLSQLDAPTQTGSELIAMVNAGATDDISRFVDPPHNSSEVGRLGKYILRKLLGQGGMGAVFAATDPTLSREVAIKLLNPSISMMPLARSRFLREARVMASLQHDNIVPLYEVCDVQEGSKPLYLVMPLLIGETLESKLFRDKTLTLDELVQVAREVLAALSITHQLGIVHRDIKPANIWLEQRPIVPGLKAQSPFRVRVLDFGLARDAEGPGLTSTGFYLGTPGYSPPEQIESRKLDARADLFSLGCVLYQAATGDRPFKGPTISAVVKAVIQTIPTPLSKRCPHLPEPVASLIEQCLQKDATNRPVSAAVALLQIDRWRDSLKVSEENAKLRGSWANEPVETASNSSLRIVILLFVAIFLIGIAVGVYFWPKN
jgi:serine/threonine protein kinase